MPPTPSPLGPKAAPQRPNAGDAVLGVAINSSRLTTRLMAAAMRRCDHFNDSDDAREAMRLDVLKTPLRLQQELLDYFNSVN